MIKAIKKLFDLKNKISYVYVVYWFDYWNFEAKNLAFRDKNEAVKYIHELKCRDLKNGHRLVPVIETIELL